MTDGRRKYLETTLSYVNLLEGPITNRIIHDDSGDKKFARWLDSKYWDDYTIIHTGRRSGFGGAIQSAWSHLQVSENNWVFHLEDDFVINQPIDLNEMMYVMNAHPELIQIALKRQPWNEQEKEAGDLIKAYQPGFTEKTDGMNTWVEHRKFFTTNPSLYRKSLIGVGWPDGNHSEGMFGQKLLQDDSVKFAYWGELDSKPKVTHIGDYRNGAGY